MGVGEWKHFGIGLHAYFSTPRGYTIYDVYVFFIHFRVVVEDKKSSYYLALTSIG
jgi:hypothetical protein